MNLPTATSRIGTAKRARRRPRTGRVIGAMLLVGALLAISACGGDNGETGDNVSAAEQSYIDCGAEHGIEVTHVEIGPATVDVDLAEDAPSDALETLLVECEPAALAIAEGGSEDPDLPGIPEEVENVDDYFAKLEDQGFSGSILIARDGDVSARPMGLADRESNIATTDDTAFDIGSVAKSFTAVAVLQLVDDGLVSLDDTLGELLADVPPDKAGITVLQLLDFTSGLHEYHDTGGDFEPMTRRQARDAILDQELRFEPGADEAYSNSSYTLAAILVEEVTGRDFTDVVEGLFDDAGLQHTGFYGSATLNEIDVATGYEADIHGENNPRTWELSWALTGAGGIVSSAGDLHTWWLALEESQLLTRERTELLFEAILPADALDGVAYRGIAGTNDFGFDAIILDILEHETLVVVLSNANPPDSTVATDAATVLARLTTE